MFFGTYQLMMDRYNLPISTVDKSGKWHAAGTDTAARHRARKALLTKSDRLLADMGISRERLEAGVQAWPWRVEPSSGTSGAPAAPVAVTALDASRPDVDIEPYPVIEEQRRAA